MSTQLRYGIGISFVIFIAYLFYQGSPQAPVVTALGACVLMHLFMMGSHGSHGGHTEGEHKREEGTAEKGGNHTNHGCH